MDEFFIEDDFRRRRVLFKSAVQEAISCRIGRIEAEVLRVRSGAGSLSSAILTGELAMIHGLSEVASKRRHNFLAGWAAVALSGMGLPVDMCDHEEDYLRSIEPTLQRPLDMACNIRAVALADDAAGSVPFEHVAWWLRDLDRQLRAFVSRHAWRQLLNDVRAALKGAETAVLQPAAADVAALDRLVRVVLFGVGRLCSELEPQLEAAMQELSERAASTRALGNSLAGAPPQDRFFTRREREAAETRQSEETATLLDLWSLAQLRVAAQGLRNQAVSAFRRCEPARGAGDDEKGDDEKGDDR
jgi:hypothetical protein